jgi:hypothetical protein
VRAAAVLGVGLAAASARASDPPHWSSASIPETSIGCATGCHQIHQAAGGTLTAYGENVTLCQSCHSGVGLASALAINRSDIAVPGQRGSSHAFAVQPVNAAYGAQAPTNTQMSLRVMGGYIVCSTCHDQHASTSALGGTPRISPARRITALGSTASVASGGTFTGTSGAWYLVEVQAGNTFRWSKDSGISWMAQGVAMSRGSAVALADGVTVTFSAANSFVTGERWELSGAYPFLRASLDSGDNATGDRFCRDCHASWTMDHVATRTWDGTMKSHPVGVGLNGNGDGYDRTVPLDANGAAQGGGGDANRANDLRLDAGGRVQCLSCHAPHFAPSNSAAVVP